MLAEKNFLGQSTRAWRRSVAGLVATAERSHVLERLNIKLAIPRQCEVNLLGQLRRTGSYYE